jgi:uncharacterized protein (DUF111 family)
MDDQVLVLRAPCGLGGDMLVAGLAALAGLDDAALAERIALLRLPSISGENVRLATRLVHGIVGHQLQVRLPHEHAHRGLADIADMVDRSALLPAARKVAMNAFRRLAEVEGEMHSLPPEEIHFHEVGALDSVLDTCLAAQLHVELGSPEVVCGPLPLGDGVIRCQHGLLAAPAPAVLRMLEGVPVYGAGPVGETVTPTALALLHALPCRFGDWPAMTVRRTARAYGTRVFETLPNGLILAMGTRAVASHSDTQRYSHVHGAAEHAHPQAHDHTHD